MKRQNATISRILQLLIIIVQIAAFSETTHVQAAKSRILREISKDVDFALAERPASRHGSSSSSSSIERDFPNIRREYGTKISGRSRRWSHRRRLGAIFSPWSGWSHCDDLCQQRRERHCYVRTKCGHSKHIEERRCPHFACDSHYSARELRPHHGSVYDDDDDDDEDPDDRDYFVVKKHRPRKKKIVVEVNDYDEAKYEDDVDDEHYHTKNVVHKKRHRPRVHRVRSHRPYRHRGRRRKTLRKKVIWDRQFVQHQFDDTADDDANDGDVDEDVSLSDDGDDNEYDDRSQTNIQKKKGSSWRAPVQTFENPPILERNYGGFFEPTSLTLQGNHRNIPIAYVSPDTFDEQQTERIESISDSMANRRSDLNQYFDRSMGRGFRQPGEPEIDFDMASSFFRKSNVTMSTTTTTTTTMASPLIGNNGTPSEFRRNGKEKAVFDMPGRYRRVYSKWSKWSTCSAKCTTRRFKRCRNKSICGNEVIREVAYCYTDGSFCQTWIDSQVKRPVVDQPIRPIMPQAPLQTTTLRPYHRRSDAMSPNAISNDFHPNSGRSSYNSMYEYAPQDFKCGASRIRNKPKNYMWGMLRIIGGKTSRKGQWPWQVLILNRLKDPICGGTLISRYWVLTAAHCVRKKLYVRLGEHNLAQEEGSEIQYRVNAHIKHPKYNKETIDNDVAMLRLPKESVPSTFVGYACLPKSYQPLPKTHQCTVVGWGKRKNSDGAGTNILHEAEVPIVPIAECLQVYDDDTITDNMFCAGYKKRRIDTCSGDSGGPLLCRDTSMPHQPWTIFGITSFGDGCGKKNKYGIYARVPMFVDWIWSVVNCDGDCHTSPI